MINERKLGIILGIIGLMGMILTTLFSNILDINYKIVISIEIFIAFLIGIVFGEKYNIFFNKRSKRGK